MEIQQTQDWSVCCTVWCRGPLPGKLQSSNSIFQQLKDGNVQPFASDYQQTTKQWLYTLADHKLATFGTEGHMWGESGRHPPWHSCTRRWQDSTQPDKCPRMPLHRICHSSQRQSGKYHINKRFYQAKYKKKKQRNGWSHQIERKINIWFSHRSLLKW